MKVYLVEDRQNSPGKVYAIFAEMEDADAFADSLSEIKNIECSVIERSLIYGQPSVLGVNP